MSKKKKSNKKETYDFDTLLERKNITSPTPSNVSDDLMTTVATIGTTDRVWCPECRKKGKDHEIKETDDLNKHYMKIHSDVPLKRATLWKKDKKKQNMMDDLNYMKFVSDS